MKHLTLLALILLATSRAAYAEWHLYRESNKVIASVDCSSYAPFNGQPSVWVRWHYAKPKDVEAGVKIQFTADCKDHRLFEIASIPYDVNGDPLTSNEHYDSPKEYPVTPNSLNEATYKLLLQIANITQTSHESNKGVIMW